LAKNGLGYIYFFHNSSGHPGHEPEIINNRGKKSIRANHLGSGVQISCRNRQLFFDSINYWLPRVIQGDQIGRILAYWAIIYFGRFFKTTEGAQTFVQLFFTLFFIN
jgi:hypothetical protein